jgi:hypothetical protein
MRLARRSSSASSEKSPSLSSRNLLSKTERSFFIRKTVSPPRSTRYAGLKKRPPSASANGSASARLSRT